MARLKWFLVLVGLVSALALPATASATSVTNPSAELYQGGSKVTNVVAGSTGGLTVFFTASSPLGTADTVWVDAPVGTVFDNALLGSVMKMTNVTDAPTVSTSTNATSISSSGTTVAIAVPNLTADVGVGDEVRIQISLDSDPYVTFGTVAGDNSFQISTTQDPTPVATPSYVTTPAASAYVDAVNGLQMTPFNQLFDPQHVKVIDEFGNGVPGQEVSATVAPSGPSGTFAGGTTVEQVVTGADGEAALPRITANSQIGLWDLAFLGPNGLTDNAKMYNLAFGDPSIVTLALSPSSLVADGSSKSLATATVTDQFGNKVPGKQIAVTSNGSQQIGAVTDKGDGTFTADITASSVVGQSVITASDGDELTGTATLTQTAVPIPPKVVKPKLRFVHPPKKKVKSAKVKFKFKVVKGRAKSFQCKLDKKKWSKCKSPKKVRLKKGKHVFKVRGIATNGIFGKPIVRRIKRLV